MQLLHIALGLSKQGISAFHLGNQAFNYSFLYISPSGLVRKKCLHITTLHPQQNVYLIHESSETGPNGRLCLNLESSLSLFKSVRACL